MAEEVPRVYQFKITLKFTTPPVWRRILVPENFTFKDLHYAIQMAMGWRNAHLHKFEIEKKIISKIFNDGSMDELNDLDEAATYIKDFFKKLKTKAVYEYDFGDSWMHIVELEKIEPADPGEKYPKCLAGKRACPPEDCGGPWGFEELLDVLKKPTHKYYKEKKEWMDDIGYESYKPERFSPGSAFQNWGEESYADDF